MLKDEATNKAAASDSAEFQWRLEQAETERKEIEESKRQFSESEKFAS